MQVADLAPYFGRRCQMMVQCAACGRTHTHEGTLSAARRPGELAIDGRIYQYAEIRALVLAPVEWDGATAGVSRPSYMATLFAGVALALLCALRLAGG